MSSTRSADSICLRWCETRAGCFPSACSLWASEAGADVGTGSTANRRGSERSFNHRNDCGRSRLVLTVESILRGFKPTQVAAACESAGADDRSARSPKTLSNAPGTPPPMRGPASLRALISCHLHRHGKGPG